MSVAAIVVAVLGGAMLLVGIIQFREPWTRYQALKAQESNIARYEQWRGGLRDSGPTGASVAMEMLRAKVRNAAIAIATGVLFLVVGLFFIR